MKNSLNLFKACLIISLGILSGGTSSSWANAATNLDNSISMPAVELATARELYNIGTKKLAAGKLDDAETLYESSLAKQDERVQTAALFNLGHVRFDQGIEELKKSPDGAATTRRAQAAADDGTTAIANARDALAGNEVQQMLDAYIAGRGVRKEMRSAMKAIVQAMAAHGKTLSKWRRALSDFQSAAELDPADTKAAHNADVVAQAIAKLVDSFLEMQQAAANLAGKQSELGALMKDLKGKIPAPNMPPGVPGDEEGDEGDDGKKPSPESLSGLEESDKGGGGQEMGLKISPEQAGQLMNNIQPDGKQLPMGQGETGTPKNRSGRVW